VAANLIADAPILFIDRCAWSKKLGEALDQAKIPFVTHHSLFEPDAADEDWLRAVKDNGWVILTRDKNIRYKANEHRALVDAGLFMLVLTQGGLSAEETARIVTQAYPEICKVLAKSSPPAIFSLTRAAEVNPLKLNPL